VSAEPERNTSDEPEVRTLNLSHIMRYDDRTANWRVLNQGKKGDDVAQLQFRLVERGYLDDWGDVDGIFGSGTYNAVWQYQSDHGLYADGIAGSATLHAMAYHW